MIGITNGFFLKIFFNPLVRYLLPHTCLGCVNYTAENFNFCNECYNELNFISRPFCSKCGKLLEVNIFKNLICGACLASSPKYFLSRSLLKFDNKSKLLIHKFKYYDKYSLAKTFAKMAKNRYFTDFTEVDIILPVPMNRFKRLFRMYNHAQIFGIEVAKLFQKVFFADLLIKTKWTKSQTSLSKSNRKKNLLSSFEFNKRYNIKGKNLLLIDDVKTTGATINQCSKILKQNGAKKVYVLTIATT